MNGLTHAYAEPRMPARAVVLGAGGFLGSHLVAALGGAGAAVLALGSREIDLAEPAAGAQLAERLREGDTLVFFAALTPDKGRDCATLMRNLAMARAVCEAAKRVKLGHLVYASSDAVYPFGSGPIDEDSPAAPADLYGTMHRTRELMLAAEAPAPLAVLRLTAVYGAGDTHNSYGPNRFVRQALKERRIALFGNGEEARDHLFVENAAAIFLSVIRHGSRGLLNVATGTSMPFLSVAREVAAQAGAPVAIEPSARQNPVTHRHFDIANLIRAFPAYRPVPLADGLRRMIAQTA
jgi:nucleoside-diphosphate-sugar epimerase